MTEHQSHKRLPDDAVRKVVPCAAEAERIEARRAASREAKRRKAMNAKDRHASVVAWVEQLIQSGTGPATRRVLMLDILQKMNIENANAS